ncbi:Tyrosine-protein kinase receptor Tie-2 [Acropora cervicornis]|uniref:Tyrosine-protein kinase receptor Tie-2 n=1 Tax=Acropora cervicornis TaxID=6130 RepID=A0AAD9USB0_ACRCE|nr:Tyrosine-protein kinase receptor Tie-2 [Acropora cervicornis]
MKNSGQYIEMTDTPNLELERNEIKFIRLLGSSNFGELYKAIVNDCAVAVKSLKENASQKDKQDMFTELHMMKYLKSHNHVVQMIGYSTRSDPILLILEYMPYGDLLGYLRISRGHHGICNSGEKKPTSRLTNTELLWSYGIVLWEVFTIGDSPYARVEPRQVASLLERGYRMPRPNHISEELYSVMSECWSEKPEDRPSFQWICTAMKRLINDHKTYVNLDIYNDEDYVNFDMVDELQ